MADTNFPADGTAGWTFDLALRAVCGAVNGLDGKEVAMLAALAAGTWYGPDSSPSDADDVGYHIYGVWHFGAKYDRAAGQNWLNAVAALDAMVRMLEEGETTELSLRSMRQFVDAANLVVTWLDGSAKDLSTWAKDLNRDDSGFTGKAASVIQQRLDTDGKWTDDLHTQIVHYHGRSQVQQVTDALNALYQFGLAITRIWGQAHIPLRDLVVAQETEWTNYLYEYLGAAGIVKGDPRYMWNTTYDILQAMSSGKMTVDGKGLEPKDFVDHVLDTFPLGSLRNGAGFTEINRRIAGNLQDFVHTNLDVPAATAINDLAKAYENAARFIAPLTTPDVATNTGGPPPGTPPPPPPNGSLPPPPGGDKNKLPPPPGGENNTKLPPPPGGEDNTKLPPPPGDSQTKLPPPPGDSQTKLPPPPGDSATKLPPPPNADKADLHLPPPPGDDQLHLPPFVPNPAGGLPSGPGPLGGNRLKLPPAPGGGNPFGEDGKHLPGTPGAPRLGDPGGSTKLGPSGLGGLDHTGTTVPGSGLPGSTVPGAPGTPGVSGPQRVAGGPELGEHPATNTGNGSGGVPFFPPMAGGGAGGTGEKPQERERQTWLAEEEEIWGTEEEAGIAVVGRPEAGEQVYEEEPAAMPSRPVRAPRQPAPTEQKPEQAPAAGGTATAGAGR